LKLALSKAAEDGLKRAINAKKERLWRAENADAIRTANAYIDENGLPLA
jgi:antitoxin CcdA